MLLFFLFGISSLLNGAESQKIVQVLVNESASNDSMLRETYESTASWRQKALHDVTYGLPRFSSLLLQKVAHMDSNNCVISPLGVALTLSMASYGAREETLNALKTVLQLPSSKTLSNVGFQALIDDLTSCTGVELRMANGVFVSSEIHPRNSFIQAMTQTFRSSVQNIDFAKSSEASDAINQWCENKTASHIKTLIRADDIHEDTSILLMNALYFKGTWLTKFDKQQTRNRRFYVNGVKPEEIPTMSIEGIFSYGEYPEVDATFVQLPYQSGNDSRRMSMFIILPKRNDGLNILEENFQNITVQELVRRGTKKMMHLMLPKFKIENEIDLKIPLTEMDLGCLFNSREANFRGIDSSAPMVVTKVVQKAIVEIDEEGSEAAAATGLSISSRSADGDLETLFYAIYPFHVILTSIDVDGSPLIVFNARFTGSEAKTL